MDERQRRIQQRRTRRRRNELIMKCIIALLLIVVIALGAVLIKEFVSGSKKNTQGRGNSGAGEVNGQKRNNFSSLKTTDILKIL